MHQAEAAGLAVILHGGGGTPYGQHFSYAMPSMPWAEFFVGSDPGVPLAQAGRLPGMALPVNGRVRPGDAPGFGLEIQEGWLTPFFG